MTPEVADPVLRAVSSSPLAHAVRAVELVRRQGVSLAALFAAAGVGAELPRDAVVGAELEIKYAGYFEKERSRANKLQAMGAVTLSPALEYGRMTTLSMEARQKFSSRRPATLAQAGQIPGVSPADLQNLVWELERSRSVR